VILYHFTGIKALVGPDGVTALKPQCNGLYTLEDIRDHAAEGSILRAGLRPGCNNVVDPTWCYDFDHLLRKPLAECVWLTENADMPRGCSRPNKGGAAWY
jgi:hypothetical protein